jgi:hypothetical protein
MPVTRDLLRSQHFIVTVDDVARLVRRARTAAPFESVEQIESAYEALLRALEAIDRPRYAQLIDARMAPPRNDPAFEAAVTRYHDALYSGFRAVAVLVRSAAGRLQVRRMLDASGVGAPVFSDEAAALAFLQRETAAGAK